MKFVWQPTDHIVDYGVRYVVDDYAFDRTNDWAMGGGSSVLVNFLSLEMDQDGTLRYIWGYCPDLSWIDSELEPPETVAGIIEVKGLDIVPGCSYSLVEPVEWPIFVDRDRGWICVGSREWRAYTSVEFSVGCVAVLDGDDLVAVWLKPGGI